MKRKLIISAVMAATLTTTGFAVAQGYGDRNDRNDRGRNEQSQRNDQQDRRGSQNRARNDGRDERGAGPNHSFRRGERLPVEYRHRQYVVDDWRGHRLSAPPRGYHWVQTGSDFVLVAIATGIIAQLLLNN